MTFVDNANNFCSTPQGRQNTESYIIPAVCRQETTDG